VCKVRATKFFSVAPDIFSLTATVHMHRAGGAVDCEVVRFTGHYSIYLLSICLSMCLSVCSSVCLPIYPSVPPSARPSIRLSFLCLSLSLSLSLGFSLSFSPSVCVRPSVRPPRSIDTCLSNTESLFSCCCHHVALRQVRILFHGILHRVRFSAPSLAFWYLLRLHDWTFLPPRARQITCLSRRLPFLACDTVACC